MNQVSTHHRLLQRQIRKYLGNEVAIGPELNRFLNVISNTYEQYEEDHQLIERSMSLSSEELLSLNQKLREEAEQEKKALQQLKNSIIHLQGAEEVFTSKLQKIGLLEMIDLLTEQIKGKIVAERKLQESESNLTALVENTQDAIFSLDKDLHLIFFNSIAGTIFQLLFGQAPKVGEHIKNMLPKEAYIVWKNRYKKALRGKRFTEQDSFRNRGIRNYFEHSFNPIRTANDEVIGVSVFSKNITERKLIEKKRNLLLQELESANKELKDFAQVTSHDLKSPLRAIGSLVSWIETDYAEKFDETGKEQLSLLKSRISKMYAFIDAMLTYTQVGRTRLRLEDVDIKQLVEDIANFMVDHRDHVQIKISDELPTIRCDRLRIQQLFQNLINNAVKFIDKKEGVVRISCHIEKTQWRFMVQDNGTGIEAKYFQKIFQVFQTLNQQSDEKSTGIGLTIARKIIEMHQGKIWLESIPGEGSTFFFTIPFHLKEDHLYSTNENQIKSTVHE